MSLLDDAAAAFRQQVALQEDTATAAMTEAWQTALAAIVTQRGYLLDRLEAARATGPVSVRWLYEQQRLAALSKVARAEVFRFSGVATRAVVSRQTEALAVGRDHAMALGNAATLDRRMRPAPGDVLDRFLGHLADGSPVRAVFDGLPAEVDAELRRSIIAGVATGRDSRWIVKHTDAALDIPRWRAVRVLRTEYQRAYRAAQAETFLANADEIAGWVWRARRDHRVCIACLVMDGTEHKVSEPLPGHPLCRCQMIPFTHGRKPRPRVTGQDWLKRQHVDVQRSIMGPGKFDAWQEGHVSLPDMAELVDDPRWGPQVREPSLHALLGGVTPPHREHHHEPEPEPAGPTHQDHLDTLHRQYGSRVHVEDHEATHKHVEELATHVPEAFAGALNNAMGRKNVRQGTEDAGIYIGSGTVPDLDDLGHLRGVQPRGWDEGQTWDVVPGAFDSHRGVLACGGDHAGGGHGSTSLVLHEGGHAYDWAMGFATGTERASHTDEWVAVWRDVLGANGSSPYYSQEGWGAYEEAWAEAFAAWAKNRGTDELYPAIVRAVGMYAGDTQAAARKVADYMESVLADLEERARGTRET